MHPNPPLFLSPQVIVSTALIHHAAGPQFVADLLLPFNYLGMLRNALHDHLDYLAVACIAAVTVAGVYTRI